ncbi:MAG TPA: decaprenyl-phosphate phosphoribosyltransferase [Candidatus Hydrogenedentes bacterium]|nr:decaprenyl-phosphate phosphoribosyltransferase [Candidatus Hydrogenedentota bacterium]
MFLRQIRLLFQLMRWHQWTKNAFVFAAPVFGKELFVPERFGQASAAFVAFCLASSAVYIVNDLFDLERDRNHPQKRRRPLPAGRVEPKLAVAWMAVLIAGSIGVAFFFTNLLAALVIAGYIVANVLYSRNIKHWVIMDVMFIAVGFLLRILAGAFATFTEPSYWLLLCTLNISLFLGFVKRRSELISLADGAVTHRRVLEHYSPAFLDQMIAIVTSTTLVCYILYTVDARTVHVFNTRMLILSVPSVMYGLFRYLYLSYHLNEGGSPSRAVVMDKPFLANIAIWGLICLGVIYGKPYLGPYIEFLK